MSVSTMPRSLDVPLGHDRTLRVSLVEGEDGGRTLVLASGFGSDGVFRRPPWAGEVLVVPAAALPGLRAALKELDR